MTDDLFRHYAQVENTTIVTPYLNRDLYVLEATARHLRQTTDLGNGCITCRVLGKFIMYVDADDDNITPYLCVNGYWESWITLAISRILKAGWFCVDIGSNHGYYTLLMADAVGTTGHVLAIEPNPKLVNLLARSLEANQLQRQVTFLQKAASDTDHERVTLAIPRRHGINATIRRAPYEEDDRVEVETVTLDQLTRSWPRIDLIKIDAEGSEDAIWRGMCKLVERNPEVIIIMEFVCSRYADPQGFLRQIQDVDFKLQYIDLDSTIKEVTANSLLSMRAEEDKIWMLYLHRAR